MAPQALQTALPAPRTAKARRPIAKQPLPYRLWNIVRHWMSLVAAGYADAIELQREARRKYPFMIE